MNRNQTIKILIVLELILLGIYLFLQFQPYAVSSLALPPREPKTLPSTDVNSNPNSLSDLESARTQYGLGYFVSSALNLQLPIAEAFRNLPKAPNDFFEKITPLQNSNSFSQFFDLSSDYFLQPEFLPSFTDHALQHYNDPNPSHFFLQGFGVLPFEQSLTLKPGEQKHIALFWHSAFGVQSYQGMKINSYFPAESFSLQNKLYNSQNPVQTAQNFAVDIQPHEVLLGPAYPFFDPQWNQKIIVQVTALPVAQPGSYVIAFEITSPSYDNESQWQSQFSPYISGAEIAKFNFPRARINVTVLE